MRLPRYAVDPPWMHQPNHIVQEEHEWFELTHCVEKGHQFAFQTFLGGDLDVSEQPRVGKSLQAVRRDLNIPGRRRRLQEPRHRVTAANQTFESFQQRQVSFATCEALEHLPCAM